MNKKWEDRPYQIEVKENEVRALCTCDLSDNGPFCDGAHKECSKKPEIISFPAPGKYFICGCQNMFFLNVPCSGTGI